MLSYEPWITGWEGPVGGRGKLPLFQEFSICHLSAGYLGVLFTPICEAGHIAVLTSVYNSQ